jgi:hypothetical protein
MAARAGHEGRQSCEEVERFEQKLRGAVAKRPLEPVHDPAVAAEAPERERRTRDIAAEPLELLSLLGPAGDRRIQREAGAGHGERLGRLAQLGSETGNLQTQRLAPCNRAHRNAVAHRRALDGRERVVVGPLEVQVGRTALLLGVCHQHPGAHQGPHDAPDQRVEQTLELVDGRRPGTMKARVAPGERVSAVEHQQMQVDVQRQPR